MQVAIRSLPEHVRHRTEISTSRVEMTVMDDSGAYVLIVTLDQGSTFEVGGLGRLSFQPGTYYYVGSALAGFRARLRRYFLPSRTRYWHIDYLLEHAKCAGALCLVTSARDTECRIARTLGLCFEGVTGFGCSDCSCGSHLFWNPR